MVVAPVGLEYSSAGVLDWQATTFTGEARYLGVAHDGLGNMCVVTWTWR